MSMVSGPELIRDAAKEAVMIADLLVVCGFAFNPLAGEEAATLGRLTVLQARMNPDLAMGDELLTKTGSGNLLMVFGEPEIEVRPSDDGRLTLEIHGLDVYDPTTGQVRSSSVDDIAAWFLDTDYDGDAFFVRHAYFTGADDPYNLLRNSLAADVSDEVRATVNSTVSRPFAKPTSGKVDVKVINHYGDASLLRQRETKRSNAWHHRPRREGAVIIKLTATMFLTVDGVYQGPGPRMRTDAAGSTAAVGSRRSPTRRVVGS